MNDLELNTIIKEIEKHSLPDKVRSDIVKVFKDTDLDNFEIAIQMNWDNPDIYKSLIIAKYVPDYTYKTTKAYAVMKSGERPYESFIMFYNLYVCKDDIFIDITKEIFGEDFEKLNKIFFIEMRQHWLELMTETHDGLYTLESLITESTKQCLDDYKNSRYLPQMTAMIENIIAEISLNG
jgi:hypothetical protein